MEVEFANWNYKNFERKINDKWYEYSNFFSFEKDPYERMVHVVLYSDTVIQLESVGIRAADTMSMVNSVESRSFFLSQDIMEFALNLPSNYKIDLNRSNPILSTKPLLKALYTRKFGEELIFEKQGFSGYPNEAALMLVNKQFPFLYNELKFQQKSNKIDRALQWKMMNTELFIKEFYKYL